ncbi:MAG: CDF family Co(II)/Ni(II) efflux transporter DmeF, partial [Spirochaetaceae bacterium]|nr:CDF family Co(II)/Ni(II) efflux transporter DmeF [Spirochaetaceae bacterium]
MALLADGWHMGTHMAAFLIAVIAYSFASRNRDNPRFTFGTGKIGVLGGYTSSILLVVVAAVMCFESVKRLLNPEAIRFGEALIIAVVGLIVNVASALILKDDEGQTHGHGEGRAHSQGSHLSHRHDKNLRAAYIHVIADAFTSVTAISALVLGLIGGITWIDSVMGLLGSAVILAWAYGILKDTTAILIDYLPAECDLVDEISKAFAGLGDAPIVDLHVWQVSPGKYAAIVAIETQNPRPVEDYYRLVEVHEELVHVSIQVSRG